MPAFPILLNIILKVWNIYELPSGRIGFKTDGREKINQVRKQAYSEEFYSYTEEFHKYFKRRRNENINRPEQELYTKK